MYYVKTYTQMYIFQNKRNGTPNLETGERVKTIYHLSNEFKNKAYHILLISFYVEIVSLHFLNHTFY